MSHYQATMMRSRLLIGQRAKLAVMPPCMAAGIPNLYSVLWKQKFGLAKLFEGRTYYCL